MKYFSKNSSSFHILSEDKRLNLFNKILWLIFNFVNNNFIKKKYDTNLFRKKYEPSKKNYNLIDQYTNSSPSRILCNMFFLDYNWEQIKSNFNKINILEIGCGRGVQLKLFDEIFKDGYSYLGIDIKEYDDWKTIRNEKIKFVADNYLNFAEYLNETNIIFSQSALEHLDEDILLFKKISSYINRVKKKKILNLHFFPSTDCFYTYRGHGIRQYNEYSVSKLTQFFENHNVKNFYYLGNKKFNNLHKQKFNRSLFKKTNINNQLFVDQFKKIMQNEDISSFKNSSFNVLEIKTNF